MIELISSYERKQLQQFLLNHIKQFNAEINYAQKKHGNFTFLLLLPSCDLFKEAAAVREKTCVVGSSSYQ